MGIWNYPWVHAVRDHISHRLGVEGILTQNLHGACTDTSTPHSSTTSPPRRDHGHSHRSSRRCHTSHTPLTRPHLRILTQPRAQRTSRQIHHYAKARLSFARKTVGRSASLVRMFRRSGGRTSVLRLRGRTWCLVLRYVFSLSVSLPQSLPCESPLLT